MKSKLILILFALIAIAMPAFAQGQAASSGGSNALPAAYIAVGIAAGLCGLGQGRAVASSAEAMARNPGAIAAIRVALILGLAFMESLTLFAVVITYIAKSS